MKISFNPSVNYTNSKKSINTQKQAVTNPNQYNEIQKNSMAELLGRCQTVSFGAINRSQGPIFEHTCHEKFGFGEKDVIKYNKETGYLKHEIYNNNGSLVKLEEFSPAERNEIITTYDDDGTKTVQTTSPELKTIEKYDARDREIYLRQEDAQGSVYTRETDHKRQRCVHREQENPNSYERIMVIDLRTNRAVTTGALVIDRRYDKQSNLYITENIVTKQILKTEQRRANGDLQRYVEYVEGSGLVKREINYQPETGGYQELIYTGQGRNNLSKVILTSKDKKREQIIEYRADGRTVESNVIYTKNKNKEVTSITVLVGLTDQINYRENYFNGFYTRTKYNNSPNVPQVEETFDSSDKSLISRVIFYDDGKRKYQIEEYNDDNSWKRTTLNPRGKKIRIECIEANGFVSEVEEFDERTGYRSKLMQYDEQSGFSFETFYDAATGATVRTEKRNRNHELEEQLDYYEDGTTPRRQRIYNFDGSYKETLFYEDGTVKNEVEYDKYGQRKAPNNRRSWNSGYRQNRSYQQQGYSYQQQGYSYQQQGAGSTTGTSQGTRVHVENDNDFMDRISSIINKSTNRNGRVVSLFRKSDLSDAEWERLSKLVNISDVQVVKDMDKATYRQLTKQFHPDLNLDKSAEEQAKAEKLFRIIQGLYEQ